MTDLATDIAFMRKAIALAMEARQNGDEPFGAVLVKDDEIVASAVNGIFTLPDPTAHAETRLIREYCQSSGQFSLEGHTLYTSTQPCFMCAGAIHWSSISRMVYSVSSVMLMEIVGGVSKVDSLEILRTMSTIDITGPVIPEEGLKVFEGYTFR